MNQKSDSGLNRIHSNSFDMAKTDTEFNINFYEIDPFQKEEKRIVAKIAIPNSLVLEMIARIESEFKEPKERSGAAAFFSDKPVY